MDSLENTRTDVQGTQRSSLSGAGHSGSLIIYNLSFTSADLKTSQEVFRPNVQGHQEACNFLKKIFWYSTSILILPFYRQNIDKLIYYVRVALFYLVYIPEKLISWASSYKGELTLLEYEELDSSI